MTWWNSALYDTCSLITLDKIFLDHPELEIHFQTILAIESVFTLDNLRQKTADRIRPRIKIHPLPPLKDVQSILRKTNLPSALAEVDKHVYVTVVHHGLAGVTADRALGKEILKSGLLVGSIALILKELVLGKVISVVKCDQVLADLANRNDFILSPEQPQTWKTLKHHTFP